MIKPLPPGYNRRHLWLWSLLAITSLAVAGLFAGLLVLSRAPGISEGVPWPENFFQKGLIVHVSLSFVVWFLAVFSALNTAIIPNTNVISHMPFSPLMEKCSILLFITGVLALLIPAFSNEGTPSLNNYIPVIISPLYYWGLLLLALGVLILVIRVLIDLNALANSVIEERPLILGACILYITAFVAVGMSVEQLQGQTNDYNYNEGLFWGSGHILQNLNVILFLVSSSILYKLAFNAPLAPSVFYLWISGILVVIGLVGLSFYGIYVAGEPEHYSAFTKLQYALGLPVLLILAVMILGLWRERTSISWKAPASLSLASALLIFSIGTFLGLFVDGHDTRTPAHYHGVIGGINLIFIGIFYVWFLPLLGRPIKASKIISFQITVYAIGQLLFISGMFATGGMGASRKVMGTGIDMDNLSAIVATGIRDFGGAFSIIGGILFIIITLKSLFRHANTVS